MPWATQARSRCCPVINIAVDRLHGLAARYEESLHSCLACPYSARYNASFARKLHGRILPALFFCLIDFAVVPPS